jgi:hypothetical protein
MHVSRSGSSQWYAAFVGAQLTLAVAGCQHEPDLSTPGPVNAVESSTATTGTDGKPASNEQKPTLKPGAKTVALEAAGDRSYDKTFDDLRFDIEVGEPFEPEMLPEKIVAMKQQRIRIRGFILPTPQQRGIKTFVLVRDNQECCFGPGAALYDCVLVEMEKGKTAEFSILPVTVEGTFDVQEVRGPDGTHLAIYHLAAESVK